MTNKKKDDTITGTLIFGDFSERCAIAALDVAARRLPSHAEPSAIAKKAFEIADAMVAERERRAK